MLFAGRKRDEVPQDEVDPRANSWWRAWWDGGRDLVEDAANWMGKSRRRMSLVGLLAIVVVLAWMVLMLWLFGRPADYEPRAAAALRVAGDLRVLGWGLG